jgi:hypothetical protein
MNPENAYTPLTDNQKTVGNTAKILPSGEQHFDGFNTGLNISQIPGKFSGINDVEQSGINLIFINQPETFIKSEPIDFSIFSSSDTDYQQELNKDSNMFVFRPYIHYYPLTNYKNLSSYSAEVEVNSQLLLNYSLTFNKAQRKSIYG